MNCECCFECVFVAGGGAILRVFLVNPRAVTAIDGAIAIEEHSREGKVVIELEEGEIERVSIDQAHADELLEQGLKFLFRQNAGVNSGAGKAGDATEDDEQRFS